MSQPGNLNDAFKESGSTKQVFVCHMLLDIVFIPFQTHPVYTDAENNIFHNNGGKKVTSHMTRLYG